MPALGILIVSLKRATHIVIFVHNTSEISIIVCLSGS